MKVKKLLPKLKKVSFKNRKHHYKLNSSTKKRQLALNEGIRLEAKKTKKNIKKAAIAKKNRLNILRIYRKTKKVKECNKITKDMRYIDKKYKLGKTKNICGKNRRYKGGNSSDLSFQNLLGPISMYYMEIEPDTKILLLGDNHESGKYIRPLIAENKYSEDVTFVHDWIKKLGLNSDKCIDLFIEYGTGYTEQPDYKEEREVDLRTLIKDRAGRYIKGSFMDQELRVLEDVYHRAALKKMRIHQVDVRPNLLKYKFNDSFFTKENVNAVFNYLFDEGNNVSIDPDLAKNYRDLKQLFSKMIKKSPDSSKIISVVKEYVNQDIASYSEGLYSKDDLDLYGVYRHVFKEVIPSILVDTFTLFKMFTRFDEHKMERGPEICKEVRTPKNIIVFLGEGHIRVLRHLLALMFGSNLKSLINIPPKEFVEGEENFIKLDTPFKF